MSQLQDNQKPRKERLLQRVHPPTNNLDDVVARKSQADDEMETEPAIQVLAQGQGFWEGRCRLSGGKTVAFQAHRVGQEVHIWVGGELFVFAPKTSGSRRRGAQDFSTDEILCSMPGVVIAVHVSEGDTVEAGQELLVMESMKTEQVVKSPRDGTIQRVAVQPGDRVDRGMRLVAFVPLSSE